jgi:uncharacterized membrane protein
LGIFSFFKKKAFFSEQDQARIVKAISSAEKSTSGEIRLFVESKNPYMNPLERAAEIFFQFQTLIDLQIGFLLAFVRDHQNR